MNASTDSSGEKRRGCGCGLWALLLLVGLPLAILLIVTWPLPFAVPSQVESCKRRLPSGKPRESPTTTHRWRSFTSGIRRRKTSRLGRRPSPSSNRPPFENRPTTSVPGAPQTLGEFQQPIKTGLRNRNKIVSRALEVALQFDSRTGQA